MDERTKKRLKAFLIFLCVLTLIFIWSNSVLSRNESKRISMGLLEVIRPVLNALHIYPKDDHFLRKIAHFAEFCALGAELCLIADINGRVNIQRASNCAFIALLAAVTDEMIQLYVNRGSQVQDVVLDFCGALFGILFIVTVLYLTRKYRSDKKA